jgi:hypothetical protein
MALPWSATPAARRARASLAARPNDCVQASHSSRSSRSVRRPCALYLCRPGHPANREQGFRAGGGHQVSPSLARLRGRGLWIFESLQWVVGMMIATMPASTGSPLNRNTTERIQARRFAAFRHLLKDGRSRRRRAEGSAPSAFGFPGGLRPCHSRTAVTCRELTASIRPGARQATDPSARRRQSGGGLANQATCCLAGSDGAVKGSKNVIRQHNSSMTAEPIRQPVIPPI